MQMTPRKGVCLASLLRTITVQGAPACKQHSNSRAISFFQVLHLYNEDTNQEFSAVACCAAGQAHVVMAAGAIACGPKKNRVIRSD